MKALSALILVMTASGIITHVTAETLEPKAIQYDFEMKGDDAAKTCNVMLMILNLPAPEIVNFRFIAMKDGRREQVILGFSVDVADAIFWNGLPAGRTPVRLQSAEFVSPSFASSGRMHGNVLADGGVLMSTNDPQTMSDFQRAFLSGRFKINFTRAGNPTSRGYSISQPASEGVLKQMVTCINTF
jgi:hypothetical protein